jgi:hypothetical protein
MQIRMPGFRKKFTKKTARPAQSPDLQNPKGG